MGSDVSSSQPPYKIFKTRKRIPKTKKQKNPNKKMPKTKKSKQKNAQNKKIQKFAAKRIKNPISTKNHSTTINMPPGTKTMTNRLLKTPRRPTRKFHEKTEKINASSQAPLQNALKIGPKGCNLAKKMAENLFRFFRRKCQNSHLIIFSRQTDTGISFSRKIRAYCTKNQPKRMYWSREVTKQIFHIFLIFLFFFSRGVFVLTGIFLF